MAPLDDVPTGEEEVRYKGHLIATVTHQLADGRFSGEAHIRKLVDVANVSPKQQAFSTAFEAKEMALQLAKQKIDEEPDG